MSRCVVKFGGSVLAGADDSRRLALIVRGYPRPPVVVVSALRGVTDRLGQALGATAEDSSAADACRADLEALYGGAARECLVGGQALSGFLSAMDGRLERLHRLLSGIHLTGEASARLRDEALSSGERLSSLLISAVLASLGMAARECLPEDIGLSTDGQAGKALVDLAASRKRVQASLPEDEVCVVPGFYGIGRSGEPCVLGRGGSDYTASSLAWCLDAESCDLWKDAEGFMSADPAMVEGAKPLFRLSYAEAAELAYFGARILHPQTVDPAERKGIPLRIFDARSYPSRSGPVTVIGPRQGEGAPGAVRSVSHTADIAVVRLWGPAVGARPGILGRASDALAEAGINIKSAITSQTAINLLLSRNDLDDAAAAVLARCGADLERVERLANLALIAAVGEGLDRQGQAGARLLGALAEEGIQTVMAAFGASPVAAYCLVPREDEARALITAHRAFFGS